MKSIIAKTKAILLKIKPYLTKVLMIVSLAILIVAPCCRAPTKSHAARPSFDLEDIGADLLVSNNLVFVNGDGTNYYVPISYVFSQGSEDYILGVGEVPDSVGDVLTLTFRCWYAIQWNNSPVDIRFEVTCLDYVKGNVYNLTDFDPEVVYVSDPNAFGFDMWIYINHTTRTHLRFAPLDDFYADVVYIRGTPSFSYFLADDTASRLDAIINDAYDEGYSDGESAVFDPFGGVIGAVDSLLQIELLPNVRIGTILSLVIGLSLATILLRLV